MITQEEQELLDRVKTAGAWSYKFQPGEGRRLMDLNNRLVREHQMQAKIEGSPGCGGCRIRMYQAITAFLRKNEA